MGRERGCCRVPERERGELGKIPKAGSKPVAKKDWNIVARVRAVDRRGVRRQGPEHQELRGHRRRLKLYSKPIGGSLENFKRNGSRLLFWNLSGCLVPRRISGRHGSRK